MEHTSKNCEKVAKEVVESWTQADMVIICESYVFDQLYDEKDYFDVVVGNLEERKK